ncbi:MAG: DUF2442 domain-containing protein [Chitinophagaceae bacterium]|nr:DUF2442 domain-containing protein [Chitinophagaceae bacterium]
MNPRVKKVKYQDPYQLVITFSNDEIKLFNLTNYLDYPIYKTLKDTAFCKKVKVSMGTVAWDDVIDFDPDTLYLESIPFQ